MSRTYKDKPSRIKFPRNDNWVLTEGFTHRELPTIEPKKRKELDTEWHWMTTPGWWVRLSMNRPQRRAVHLWERKALFSDLEELVTPVKKVGFVYFW